MSGELLLDTNAVIRALAEDDSLRALLRGAELYVPSMVIGELYFGAFKSGRVAENVARVERLASDYIVLDCDVGTAECYGRIKNELRIVGRPIPQNDVWIAATALQYGLALVTRDAHFANVKGLAIQAW